MGTKMSDLDYYEILGIDIDANDNEIKKAFWCLAKIHHPDKNPGGEKSAEERFKEIICAYEVLMDKNKRRVYDRTLGTARKIQFQQKEPVDNEERQLCRLILSELFKRNKQNAIKIYERLAKRIPNFSLDLYMGDADTRDCEFLLAEAYHQIGGLQQAEKLYTKLLERERKRAYFHHFAQEIKLLLKSLYMQYINKSNRSEDVSSSINKILTVGLQNHELAWIYKKAAEAYYRLNDMENAVESLNQAFKRNPKLPGAKKIKRKLGFES
jgi:curved DNA-binding protein CbpA